MRGNSSNNTVTQFFGVMTWLWFGISIITVLFFLLANLKNDVQFNSTIIFVIVFLTSIISLLLLVSIDGSKGNLKRNEDNNIQYFFMQNLTIKKIAMVPLGTLAIFLVSYGTANAGQPFFGIFASGMIMLLIFYRTHAILVPIFIHGSYNAIVVLLRDLPSQSLVPNDILDKLPFDVPTIGLTIKAFGAVGSEVIFQYVLVATAEELFKIFIIAFVVVALASRFNDSGGRKWIAGIAAVLIWTVLHSIQAI